MSICSVDINVNSKIRTLSRSLPFEFRACAMFFGPFILPFVGTSPRQWHGLAKAKQEFQTCPGSLGRFLCLLQGGQLRMDSSPAGSLGKPVEDDSDKNARTLGAQLAATPLRAG